MSVDVYACSQIGCTYQMFDAAKGDVESHWREEHVEPLERVRVAASSVLLIADTAIDGDGEVMWDVLPTLLTEYLEVLRAELVALDPRLDRFDPRDAS